MEDRLPKGTLGGQAVIEGVMMKGKDSYSVAIRKPDQKIEVKLEKYESFGDKHAWARVPFIRGVVNFTESMVVGMKTLSYSSSFYEEEEEETKADKLIKEVFKEKAEGVIMGLTLFLSVILAIALFMMLPAAIGEFIGKWVDNRLLLSLIEGMIRLIIFIIYVVLISQMEDIRRVFMYHGAEHKTINCYESGDDLTPENVAKHSRYHKRCGTSFLFIVMVVSIVIFMFITADQMWLRFLLRLLLIPVVAGISYEFIKLAGRSDNAVMNILSKPGMWIQRLTTKEPEEEMIQVAIISVEAVLYGKPYVDAVNEAQGLGKAAKKEEAQEKQNEEEKKHSKKAKSDTAVEAAVEKSETVNAKDNAEQTNVKEEATQTTALEDDAVVVVAEDDDLGSFIPVADVNSSEEYEEEYEEVYEEIIEEIIYEEEILEEVQEEIEESVEKSVEDAPKESVEDAPKESVEDAYEETSSDVTAESEKVVEELEEHKDVEVIEKTDVTVDVATEEKAEHIAEPVETVEDETKNTVAEMTEENVTEPAEKVSEGDVKEDTTALEENTSQGASKRKNSKKRNSKKGKK